MHFVVSSVRKAKRVTTIGGWASLSHRFQKRWIWESSLSGNDCKLKQCLACYQVGSLSSSTKWVRWSSKKVMIVQKGQALTMNSVTGSRITCSMRRRWQLVLTRSTNVSWICTSTAKLVSTISDLASKTTCFSAITGTTVPHLNNMTKALTRRQIL